MREHPVVFKRVCRKGLGENGPVRFSHSHGNSMVLATYGVAYVQDVILVGTGNNLQFCLTEGVNGVVQDGYLRRKKGCVKAEQV